MANTIAIPSPLCFSCFAPLRRFWENLTKPFYFYLSRTCDSRGGTPSEISLALMVWICLRKISSGIVISFWTSNLVTWGRGLDSSIWIFGCKSQRSLTSLRSCVNIYQRSVDGSRSWNRFPRIFSVSLNQDISVQRSLSFSLDPKHVSKWSLIFLDCSNSIVVTHIASLLSNWCDG